MILPRVGEGRSKQLVGRFLALCAEGFEGLHRSRVG